MASAVETAVGVIERVKELLLEGDLPLTRESLMPAAVELLVDEAPLSPPEVAVDVVDALVGLGPLERLIRDPGVSDVLVNAPDEVWVERQGRLERTSVGFQNEAEIVAAVERVIAPLGLRLDRSSPAVDARLADGSRLHAVIPPASVDGPIVAVRRFTAAVQDLGRLVAAGGAAAGDAALLARAVRERKNLLVAGGTGAGKTTLLNVLSREIPAEERVVTVEDAAELQLRGHVVRLEARPPNAEGAGEITMRALLRHALRLRPDRVVVGEVRGPEALDMIQAMSTGHDGSMSTVHANGPEEALWRLESLAMMAGGVDATTIRSQLRSAIDLVVFVARRPEGRRIEEIVDLGDEQA